MKRLLFVVLALALVFFLSQASARAAMIDVAIGDQESEAPVHRQVGDNGNEVYVIGTPQTEVWEWETAEGRVRLEGILDPDPSVEFALAVTDFGAPSIFGFTFILPLAPVFPNPSVVFDSLAGAVTNGATAGGVTVTALAPPAGIPVDADGIPELQVYTLSDDGGLTWKNVGLDAGPTTVVPLGSFASGTYGAFNQGPIATIPGGPWTHMRVDLSFSLTGDGDAFVLSGAKVLVPEPGTVLLALFAAVALCCSRPRSSK